MACHIRVGAVSLCCSALDLSHVRWNGVPQTCDHEKGADAVVLLHLLQDLGVEDASIANGVCEWSPNHPDLRKFTKRYSEKAWAHVCT